MKEFIEFLIKKITGDNNFEIDQTTQGDLTCYKVKVPSQFAGQVIGKGGTTISAVRTLVRAAAVGKQKIEITVEEKI